MPPSGAWISAIESCDRIQDIASALQVMIERHWLAAEGSAELVHAERVQPLTIEQLERLGFTLLAAPLYTFARIVAESLTMIKRGTCVSSRALSPGSEVRLTRPAAAA